MSIKTTAAFYSSTRGYAVTSSFTKILLDKSTIIVSSPGRSSFTSHLSTILRTNQRSLSSSTVVDEYEKLKKSRQFRIHARLHVSSSSGNERSNIESSTNNIGQKWFIGVCITKSLVLRHYVWREKIYLCDAHILGHKVMITEYHALSINTEGTCLTMR